MKNDTQKSKLWVFLLAAVALLILPLIAQQFGNAWVRIIDIALLYVMLALGLNIVVGYAGLLDLGYVAFYAVGAYMFALLASPHLWETFPAVAAMFPNGLHTPIWLVIPLGAALAGLFATAETYVGGNGYSLRMDGLEPGINDQARARAIVMHGAPYVDPAMALRQGRLGRSFGCPALRPVVANAVIDTLKQGQLIFAYYPDRQWLANSRFFRCGANRVAGIRPQGSHVVP